MDNTDVKITPELSSDDFAESSVDYSTDTQNNVPTFKYTLKQCKYLLYVALVLLFVEFLGLVEIHDNTAKYVLFASLCLSGLSIILSLLSMALIYESKSVDLTRRDIWLLYKAFSGLGGAIFTLFVLPSVLLSILLLISGIGINTFS